MVRLLPRVSLESTAARRIAIETFRRPFSRFVDDSIYRMRNVRQPDMLIPMENKGLLIDAVKKNCGKNRDMTYLELTAMVAAAVKLQ